MITLRNMLASAIIATSFSAASPATAGDQVCGHWAFAGAYQNHNSAVRQANRFGGRVLDLDMSNSPNAGLGYWVVAKGPYSRSRAKRKARHYKRRGVRGAYAARRCFTATYNG